MRQKQVRAPLQTKRRMAREAGIGLHQMRQMVRVANIPEEEFERLIESEKPPTVEVLANLGRRKRAGWNNTKRKPEPCPYCNGTGKREA